MYHTLLTFVLLQTETEHLDPEKIKEYVPPEYWPWIVRGGITLLALLIIRAIWRRVARLIRRRRPPNIHPQLQKYNIDHAQMIQEQERQAAAIVATSTGNRLAGYRIVRQIDAVFVEGYRTPKDAINALKATAAERGANAIINVKTERTSAGKCTGSGDAVLAAPIKLPPKQPPKPPNQQPSI